MTLHDPSSHRSAATPVRLAVLVGGLLLWTTVLSPRAHAQVITNTSDQTLTVTVPFGTMTPGTSTTPFSSAAQFRLRKGAGGTGYKVTATVAFNTAPTSPAAGGTTIAASDVGVGITSIVAGSQVLSPRAADTIASGFTYNPGSVVATNGLTPYGGMAAGRATLKDILDNPTMTILSGPRIAINDNLLPGNFLTVTMTFGVLPQYFTPGSASAVVTLTISTL